MQDLNKLLEIFSIEIENELFKRIQNLNEKMLHALYNLLLASNLGIDIMGK